MSEKDLQALLTRTLNEQLKEVVAIFQANQPTEISRVTALMKEILIKELEPIKQHLTKQDAEIKEIKENIKTITLETQPLVDGKKTVSNIFKFILWSSPIAIIYSLYKWLRI